jgi:hypothetical protein
VTTGVSRLTSVWRGLGGVSRRIARFGACWRDTSPWGSSPPVVGAGRRSAPHRPVRLLLAGYWAVLGVKESRRRLAPHRPGRGLLAGYCPWDVSPPDGGGLVPGADASRGVASCWRGPARGMSRLLLAEACPRCRSISRRRNIYLNVNCGIQFLYEDMYIHLKLRIQLKILKIKI